MQTSNLVDQLAKLNLEVRALRFLVCHLEKQVDETLAQVPAGSSALREAAREYLATASNAQLRADLIEARGERSAAHLRTRLNDALEARRGRRHPNGGQAKVNGNGVHAV